jgi:uncharacterized protein YebE (UPF0316 family)
MIPILFIVGLITDILWTKTITQVTQQRPLRASIYALALNIVTLGSAWAIIQTNSVANLLAFSVGGAFGTALGVRKKK